MPDDSDPACDIIMIVRNGLDDTKRCVESVEQNTGIPHRYVFVDNCSTDGTAEYLRGLGGGCVLIENGEDAGFARATNQAFEEVAAGYAVWLDNRVMVTPGWLDRLVGHLEGSPRAGAIGPMCNAGGVMQRDYSWDGKTSPGDVYAYGERIRRKNRGLAVPYHRISGRCLVMRSEVIPAVGPLDEAFGCGRYGGDDYCRRMQDAGYGLLIAADVFVYRREGSPFSRAADPEGGAAFLMQRDRRMFLSKHGPRMAGAHAGAGGAGGAGRPGGAGGAPPAGGCMPLVSVVMPTTGRPGTIRGAIRSVLSQTYGNLELIVVNDGGADVGYLVSQFDDPRIRYVGLDRNGGKSRANNAAIDSARGEVIAYLDDDDVWYPDHLQKAVSALVRYPSRMLVYTDYVRVECAVPDGGRQIPLRYSMADLPDAAYESMRQGNIIPNFAIVHRRSLSEAERYDEALDRLEDWDLWRRFFRHAYFVHVPAATGEYWTNSTGATRNTYDEAGGGPDRVHEYVTSKDVPLRNRVMADLRRANALAKQAEWVHALQSYRRAFVAATVTGTFTRDGRRLARALQAYGGILETDPEFVPALWGCANCLFNMGRHKECGEFLSRIITLNPHGAEPYLLMAHSLVREGDFESAKRWLEVTLVAADSGEVHRMLQGCYSNTSGGGATAGFIGARLTTRDIARYAGRAALSAYDKNAVCRALLAAGYGALTRAKNPACRALLAVGYRMLRSRNPACRALLAVGYRALKRYQMP